MRDPKPVVGDRALLFERLADAEPLAREEEAQPFRVHDVPALRESVRRELWRLLNTRRHPQAGGEGGGPLTVLDYGLPDFSSLSASSGADQQRIAAAVAAAISSFEPRLRDVRVSVARVSEVSRALALKVEAVLSVGVLAEPVSFVLVRARSGEAEVYEDESA
jgi:type VI secretion system protein ImpF